jgi:hypothetical protein
VLDAERAENRSVEANREKPPQVGAMRIVGAVVAVLAACFAAFIAYLANGLMSSGDAGSHETPLLIAQLVIAITGLLPAGLFARALVRRLDFQAVVWLVISVLVNLGWGVFNDAAVHGWANLKVF